MKGTKSPLEGLPDELLLAVLQLLDPIDILRSRQACSRIYFISLDISLWVDVANHLSQSLPLPNRARISTFSLRELEKATVRAVNVEKLWLSYRTVSLRKISATYENDTEAHPSRPEHIKLFEDRYAVVCYPGSCTVILWDVDSLQLGGDGRSVRWGRILATWTDIGSIAYSSYEAQYHEANEEIFIAFFTIDNTRCISNVLSVSISGSPAQIRQFRQVVRILQEGDSTMLGMFPTGLDPESSCIAQYLEQSNAIRVTNWHRGYSKTITSETRMVSDELGSILVAIEIIGPYILAVKGRVLEIYVIPPGLDDEEGPGQFSAQTETIHLAGVNFNRASLSRLPVSEDRNVPLSVALVLTDTFSAVSYYILHLPREPSTILTCTLVLVGQDASLSTRDVFISTELALGPLGMRATWIEKSRRSMERRVVALRADNVQASGTWRMHTSQVYSTFSPDFDQDLRCITCDEVTGRIVLVTRGGELWVLDCWRRVPSKRKPLTRIS